MRFWDPDFYRFILSLSQVGVQVGLNFILMTLLQGVDCWFAKAAKDLRSRQ